MHGKIIGLESEQDFIAVTAEIPLDVHQTLPIWVALEQLHLLINKVNALSSHTVLVHRAAKSLALVSNKIRQQ